MKTSSLYIDNIYLLKKTDDTYQNSFDQFYKYLLKDSRSNQNKNILANIFIDQLIQANEKKQAPVSISNERQYRQYVKTIDKGKRYNDMKEKIAQQDHEKTIISGIWLVFSISIVLMFLKCLLTQNYFINFNIDLIFACVAVILFVQNERVRIRIIKRYELQRILIYDIGSLVCCIVCKLVVPGNFDISYLILVIDYFITKKKIDPVFN